MADYGTSTTDPTDVPKSVFDDLKCRVIDDRRAASPWYKECDLDFGFYAGGDQQWEEADRHRLDDAERPRTTFNFVAPSVSAVAGMEVSNRQQVKFLPRTTQTTPAQQPQGVPFNVMAQPGADDQGPAETLSAANDYTRDQCDAEDEESDAFTDSAICGMGWTETRVDYEEEPSGQMRVDRCDPGEMGWDRAATKRNLIDARHIHRVRQVDVAAARALFPEYEIEEIDASWARSVANDQTPHDADEAKYYRNNQEKDLYGQQTVTLCEITWYDVKVSYRVGSLETGEVLEDQTAEQLKTLRDRAKKMGMKLTVQKIVGREYRQAFLGKTGILGEDQEKGDLCQSQKGFRFKAITGWRDRNNKQWMGIVRAMRDPQRWANALYSATLNTVMTSGKGIMAERSAFEKPEQAEADWASSGNIVWLREGALSGQNPKVLPKVPTPLPPGIEKLMEFAVAAMRGVSGVNLETLGAVDRDQAASLEYQRRQAATTILAPFFDGLRRYRKEQGRLAMDLIRKYLSDGRLIRVVGPDYEKYVPLIRQDDTLEYDIIVSESPTSPNQKEATWQTTQAILPVVGKNLGPRAMAALLKASPLPESSVKEFKDAMEQDIADQQNAPPPPDVQLTMAQIEKTKAETAGKEVDAKIKQMDAAAQFQNLQLDMADRDGERQDRMAERAHKETMRGMDMAAARQKSEADAKTRQIDAGGNPDLEVRFDQLVSVIGDMARNVLTSNQRLAEMIESLAGLVSSERETEVDDPMTGEKLRAVSRLRQTVQ